MQVIYTYKRQVNESMFNSWTLIQVFLIA